MRVRDELEEVVGTPYFPFVPYRGQSLRTFQGYLVKYPRALLGLFNELDEVKASPGVDTSRPPHTTQRRHQFGIPYREANAVSISRETNPWSRDPSLVDRALAAHTETQNALASYVRDKGADVRSPQPNEPEFDIAWTLNSRDYVAEVKSLTDANQEKQLRLGLGQILRYRYQLGGDLIPVLAVEKEPSDRGWADLCESLGVILVWPGAWDRTEHSEVATLRSR